MCITSSSCTKSLALPTTQANSKFTYIKPAACHNAVHPFIGQLGAEEAQAPGHLLHYFRVVKALIRKPTQSVHLPHKNAYVFREIVHAVKNTNGALVQM